MNLNVFIIIWLSMLPSNCNSNSLSLAQMKVGNAVSQWPSIEHWLHSMNLAGSVTAYILWVCVCVMVGSPRDLIFQHGSSYDNPCH